MASNDPHADQHSMGSEDIEVIFLGRAAADLAGRGVDVLFFSTPDHTALLPVWVDPPADLGGRPTDAEILADLLASNQFEQPWFAEIVTNSRGQFTAGLSQRIVNGVPVEDSEDEIIDDDGEFSGEYVERYIDVRPSTLEPLWHAGVLFDVRLKPSVVPALLDVNPEWTRELAGKLSAVDEDGDPIEFDLLWNPEDMGFTAFADPEQGFKELWEGMGLSKELDDWLDSQTRDNPEDPDA